MKLDNAVPSDDGQAQMEARQGKVPWADVCESSFRRGFHHASAELVSQLRGCKTYAEVSVILDRADEAASAMRFTRRSWPDYMQEFGRRLSGENHPVTGRAK